MKPNKAKPDTIQHLNSIAIREYGSTLRKEEGEEEEEKDPRTITVIDKTIYSIPKVNKVFEEDEVVVLINFMDAEGNYEIDRSHGRFTWCIPADSKSLPLTPQKTNRTSTNWVPTLYWNHQSVQTKRIFRTTINFKLKIIY
ncbi:hypothetical protein PPL_03680 [Heterostelium album PN500]|uniref:Uncharacterized protein n=1 Tax=Heterostelium pallidum (strain ATCC 26659 / Pp 5 / PN500) TaxID=670386 RepID=D3B6D2_HETP5|nr:hypothetical protein PPL_03680 [Heterostelium album PN500]EFA82902.1 hypothetical protein PPL_03680 [Heterostelium album PN500]|eukprot:XP_020435019.1 hypothetical protein PPL_03680 [Heterostelium album PN500]